MNTGNFYQPSFLRRYIREVKEVSIMLLVVLFALIYKLIAPVQSIVDKGVDPAVEGLTVLYGKVSGLVYQLTGFNAGFIVPVPDQEFLFRVRLATYVNERLAAPLLDIAVDNRMPIEKRERALNAILKFESAADWIHPFLNELSKGGLLGLMDDEAPLLDELIKKIRAEGGVRQPLVRAYAEVVFSFMLQHPTLVLRLHALRWLSDVIAEDALFILIPRFEKENDPKARLALEQALYDIRAVSEPEKAKELLIPYYRIPPWPSLRLPLAAVLARLGFEGARPFITSVLQSEQLSKEERTLLSFALDGNRYPRQLRIAENEVRILADRRKMRQDQVRAAMERRNLILRQERLKQAVIAKAVSVPVPKEKPPVAEKPAPAVPPQTKMPPEKRTAPKGFPVPGAGTEVEVATPVEETVPEILDEPAPKPRSLMNYVDIVFEIKKQDVPLFQNPGQGATGVLLPVGTKGKADFEVLIGEDRWYQVKTKKGQGWVNGALLSIYNLSPDGSVPAVTSRPEPSDAESLDGSRKETTYFEAAMDEVPTFEKASEKSKKKGTLSPETPYLAVRSEKVNSDRWFLLQIRTGETAWARGIDLRLADVQQPVKLDEPSQPLGQLGSSPFTAEWVRASVKGVGVYSKPSITAKMVRQINPPDIYKVKETSADGGKEWYLIEISGKDAGWVQTMDVNLTKPE